MEPLPTTEERFSSSGLLTTIRQAEVSLRGWNYPYIGRQIRATANGDSKSYGEHLRARGLDISQLGTLRPPDGAA